MPNCSKKRGMTPFNRDDVLAILLESDVRFTARAYIREISRELAIPLGQAKKILTTLVAEQEVAYQDLYGSTYVMESFSKPVRVTDRFFILPPGITSAAGPRDIDIRLALGISFGSGHHPTTRLCLGALDTLFSTTVNLTGHAGDIGTGSGVLAVAACLAGMDDCLAWEIDANAVNEARQNVTANGLDSRIRVIDDLMSPEGLELSLVMANLRFPTLKQIAPLIARAALPGAYLILSGIRTWEKAELIHHYGRQNFSPVWEKDKKNWSVVIFSHKR